ncbi:hypothetical protein Ddye_007695 [Dipteronia dyeriana]|uniref:Uncharacterized protein n=1 Tax=Dipteronia dyeriana TaxID=168575 RepID=A0AAD9XKQ9_9ROSI|nr:hypothetical protein Ddye_007695 [Dipteronia dyeriana]
MGCAQSKIDNEESVARCKDRRNLMKDAVVSRNAFAAAHSAFSVSLKNIGAALSDYGHGEAEAILVVDDDDHHQSLDATPPPPPPPPPSSSSMDNLPPPPPPLPEFSPSPVKRTVSLPAIPLKNRKYALDMDNCTITEDDDEEEEEEEEEEYTEVEETPKNKNNNNGDNHDKKGKNVGGARGGETAATTTPSPRTPEARPVQNMAWDYFFNVDDHHHHLAGTSMASDKPNTNNVDSMADNINISNNTYNVNDNVKKDSVNSNNNVVVNEPEKVAVEKREIIEHAKIAPLEISRRSTTPTTSTTVNLLQVLNLIDDQFLKASQTAQEVSNLLEATRMHYHSNFADNRATVDHSRRVMHAITWNRSFMGIPNSEVAKDNYDSEEYETHATVLDKLMAWEKKLYEEVKQGELIKLEYHRKVAMLNKLKKREATMETMEKTKAAVSHLHTRYIVDMQSLDSTVSEVNRLRDEQLYPKLVALVDGMAKMWGNMCIHHDKQHVLVSDLKSLDSSLAPKETTKHHHERTIQLHSVVLEWNLQFEKLVMHQKQYIQALNSWLKLNLIPIESSLKEKILSPPRAQNPRIQALLHSWHDYLERLQDDLAISAISSFAGVIKNIIFHQEEEMKLKEKCEETRKEYLRKNQAYEDWYHKYQQRRTEAERGEDVNTKDPVSEKQFAVESLKKRLEEEIVAHQRHCTQVREKSLGSLKTRLPELFHALSVYAHACSDAYEKLRSVSQSNGGSS